MSDLINVQQPRRERLLVHLNKTNHIGNGVYKMRLTRNLDTRGKHATVGLASSSFFHCIFNITPELLNNTFTIRWVNGVSQGFTIPSGYYTVSDIAAFVKYCLIQNNWYLVSTSNTSQLQTHIDLAVNSVRYSTQISSYFVSNTMPAGYQLPTGATWSLPSVSTFPQITLSAGLSKLLGFTQTVFPSAATPASANQTFTSTLTPALSPVSSLALACNLVQGSLSAEPQLLQSLPINSTYGSVCSYQSSTPLMLTAISGSFDSISVRFLDQTLLSYSIRDVDACFALLLEMDSED